MNTLDNQRREMFLLSSFLPNLIQFLLALSHSGEFILLFSFVVGFFGQCNWIFFPSVETFQSLGDLGNPEVLMLYMATSQAGQLFAKVSYVPWETK